MAGEAKKRGTFEQRKAAKIKQLDDEIKAREELQKRLENATNTDAIIANGDIRGAMVLGLAASAHYGK